jgi:hypothetical protein
VSVIAPLIDCVVVQARIWQADDGVDRLIARSCNVGAEFSEEQCLQEFGGGVWIAKRLEICLVVQQVQTAICRLLWEFGKEMEV